MKVKKHNEILIKILIIITKLALINCRQIHKDVNPCENFYEYVCRNYSQENPNPNYGEITQKLDYELNTKLLNFLSNSAAYISYKNQSFSDKMRIYFESCLNEKPINLKRYFDEFESYFNLPKTQHLTMAYSLSLLGKMQSYGFNNVIISQEIYRFKNNTLDILLKPAVLEAADNLPEKNTLEMLLRALDVHNIESFIQQLNNTEYQWRDIIKHFDYSQEVITVNLEDLSWYNLQDYFNELLGSKELENISYISLYKPEFFMYLTEESWPEEDLEQLLNYLMIKFLYYLLKDSTNQFSPLACIKDLRNKFDLGVNFYYYNIFFKKEARHFEVAFSSIVQNIKNTMAKYFDENHFNISALEINYLKNKLQAIKINLGNLPLNATHQTIKDFYKDLSELHKNNYFKNHLLLLKQRFRKSLSYTQNETYYLVTSNSLGSVSSPYYVPEQNMIILPFGSFQLPLFHYNQTSLQQLSRFGFVMAHELTHAFDTTGLQYDEEGLPLATPSDILINKNFLKFLNILQNEDFTDDIDERIADFFAVRVAYRTYFEIYSYSQYRGKHLAQEFFENLAYFFCGKNDLEFIDHDSDPKRLQQITQKFPAFADAFECLRK